MVTTGILIGLVQSMTASVQTQAKVTSSLEVTKLSREIAELAVCRSPFLVHSVCMAGERIVSGCNDGAVRIWDMKGNELAVWKGHAGVVNSVCIEGGRIVSGSSDCTLRIWDMNGKVLAVCSGHQLPVMSVCIAGDTIVSGSEDKTVRIWNIQGKEIAVCRGHELPVNSVCSAGDKIVSGSGDRTVLLWDMQGHQLAVCSGHKDNVRSVCMAGEMIVSGSHDCTVRVWDMQGKQIAVCKGPSTVYAVCMAGNKIVSGSSDGIVRIWRYLNGSVIAVCRGYGCPVNSVCMAGEKIVSGSDDTVRIWDSEELLFTFDYDVSWGIRFLNVLRTRKLLRGEQSPKVPQRYQGEIIKAHEESHLLLANRAANYEALREWSTPDTNLGVSGLSGTASVEKLLEERKAREARVSIFTALKEAKQGNDLLGKNFLTALESTGLKLPLSDEVVNVLEDLDFLSKRPLRLIVAGLLAVSCQNKIDILENICLFLLHGELEFGPWSIQDLVDTLSDNLAYQGSSGRTLLMLLAGTNPQLEWPAPLADELLKRKAPKNATNLLGQTALHSACMMGNKKIVASLLSHDVAQFGVDVFGNQPVHYECASGVDSLGEHRTDGIANSAGWEPVHLACYGNNSAAVERLLSTTRNINAAIPISQKTPLMITCEKGHLELCKLLLASQLLDLTAEDTLQLTALDWACEFGHKDICDLLVKDKRLKLSPRQKVALLQRAHETDNLDLQDYFIKLWLERWKKSDKKGNTSLHYACQKGYIGAVEKLLANVGSHGLGVTITNKADKTPYQCAADNKHDDIVSLLQRYNVRS